MKSLSKLSIMRKEYGNTPLSEESTPESPFALFNRWMEEAQLAEVYEPNAFCLSTASLKGIPSSRMLLLKHAQSDQFFFFTNYRSRKGKEIRQNPNVALLFFWSELHRQVRITGKIYKASPTISNQYFALRPRGAQLGAWCSPQSTALSSRKELSTLYKNQTTLWKGRVISRPPFWGGYRVEAYEYEFWQGRKNRLHDRLSYRKLKDVWTLVRLAP